MLTSRIRHALLHVLAAVAVATGCGSDTTFPPTVSSVEVTPGTQTLTALGQTRQFTAVVKDQFGNTMAGKTVEWRSTLPSVATVDPTTGLVTAAGNGVSMITATVDFFTGSAVLTVTQQATKLIFIAVPFGATAGRVFSPLARVEVEDAAGARVTNATNAVTLTIGTNPGGAALVGTTMVNAVSGIATFTGVSLDKPGTGYTLVASAGGLTGITSIAINVAPSHGPFAQMAPGFLHTCGRTATGVAYCWGANSSGQLGDGTTISRLNPEPVTGNVTFTSLSSGPSHTCGVTAAGAAYCWGSNTSGQIGDGTTTDRRSPTLVTSSLSFSAVSAGFYHTCGITTAGAAYCWGDNATGQLGDGSMTNHSSAMPVAGSVVFTTVTSGGSTTCGLTAAADAYCWGDGLLGHIGDGTDAAQLSPLLVADSLPFTALSVGEFHTCGIAATGTYCWGGNSSGQIGDGTAGAGTNRLSPVPVTGPVTFTAVSPGGLHTCGVTAAHVAYCWGYNDFGQIGDGTGGTGTDRLSPTLVAGGLSFASVRSGTGHTCGLTPAGAAYCWGLNLTGQLGDGTTISRPAPVLVGP